MCSERLKRRLAFNTAATSGAVLCTLLLSHPASATTVVLTADRDNTLFEQASGALSNGAGPYGFAGVASSARRRFLVHFSLATVPAGAKVTAATLTLVVSRTISGSENLDAHSLLADWGEGASNSGGTTTGGGGSGAPSSTGDATWLHRFYPSIFWKQPGADFAVATSARQSVAGDGAYSWSSPQLTTDTQGWVDDPTKNFGWVIVETDTQSPKRFNARENADITTRPQLMISYTPASVAAVPSTPPGTRLPLFLGLACLTLFSLTRWRSKIQLAGERM